MASRTQIVATIGPASKSPKLLKQMIERGMDVARLNFSHGTHAEHARYIKNIRAAAKALGKRVPVIQDLSGPRMETGAGHGFDKNQPILTEKDMDDLAFGLAHGVSYVAQSYVGSAADVKLLRERIKESGQKARIIAKIERKEAVAHFDGILAAADAVMIARGDLGLSEPIEEIPFIQRNLTARANRARKPVITATQMLSSMTDNPAPTRAEVTDVAFAVLAGTDVVMLSEETARGKYPLEAVVVMERVIARAERDEPFEHLNLL